MVAAFKSLREFCKNLGIQPFAENLDYDEFSPNYLSTMSVNELQQNFSMNEEVAKQIYESLEQFRKLKKQHEKKSKRRLSNFFTNFLPQNSPAKPMLKPTPTRTFVNEFEDLSDVIYAEGDDWIMDPCSAACADSFEFFQQNYDSEKYEKYSNVYGWTPLMYACALNCEEIAAFILSKNPNICVRNEEQQTALMIAASFGHDSVIEQLVEYANQSSEEKSVKEIIGLDLSDEGGFTALHYAVFYAHHSTVTYLLELGANPNAPDIEGMTPTLMACVDEIQEQSLQELKDAGGKLNHCNRDGQNGFEIANRPSVDAFKPFENQKPLRYGSF